MYKIVTLILLVLCLFIFSCDIYIIPGFWDIDTCYDLTGYSIDEMIDFAEDNIEYKRDSGKDNVTTPQETWDNKRGDCEDIAIFLMALVNKYQGQKGTLIISQKSDSGHVYFELDGKSYLKLKGFIVTNKINFDDVPYLASTKR